MNALLWALDELASRGQLRGPVRALDAEFRNFLFVGENIELRVAADHDAVQRVDFVSGDLVLAALTLSFENTGEPAKPFREPKIALGSVPRCPSIEDMASCAGAVGIEAAQRASRLFPHAARVLGATQVAGIARLSAIVGMLCPGLHSIFNRVTLRFDGPCDMAISYRAERIDARFGRVQIAVSGAGLSGSIAAFLREAPVASTSMNDFARLIVPDEFANISGLIIGGSRGLGAVVARAIAAGSGKVVVTYVRGEEEATALRAEIGESSCETLFFDAREPAQGQLDGLPWLPSHVYYFATPKIFTQNTRSYVHALFEEFARIYVAGLESLCAALTARGATHLTVFYPSSVAVDDCPKICWSTRWPKLRVSSSALSWSASPLLCASSSGGFHACVRTRPRRCSPL